MIKIDPITEALLVERMTQGTLTQQDFISMLGLTNRYDPTTWLYRDSVVRSVSWAVITTEYADALASVLKGLWVVEVCAGKGVLARMMQARGIDWFPTDIAPWDESVESLDALSAIDKYDAEVVFGSWIPYESTLDYEIARRRVPCIFITEGWGGCIGSEDLWEKADAEGYDIFDWPLTDVPQWPSIHDHTVVVLPREYTGPLRDVVGFIPDDPA